MKQRQWRVLLIIFLVPGLMFMTSCAKKKVVKQEPTAGMSSSDNPLTRRQPQSGQAQPNQPSGGEAYSGYGNTQAGNTLTNDQISARNWFEAEDIYFAYDSSALSGRTEDILRQKAQWLQQNQWATITIEGHCDERGTNEYNLALGDRRAEAVKAFIADLGVAPSRMVTVSYGEEQPADPGHNESAWAKNRRAHFVVR